MRAESSLSSSVPPLFSSLANILSGEIDCSNQCLTVHSVDGSPLSVRPQAVIYPKTATDIKHVIAFAKEYSMPLTVRGNGNARTGGSLGEGITIDMTRHFIHMRQMNMMEHTLTVDAGVSVKALREKLRGWHMEAPILTALDNDSTIGALVATKSATPSSFRHGTIREWIEALTVVVDTGEEHRIADGITPSGRLFAIYQSVFPILSAHVPTIRAAKPETADDATGYCIWNTSVGPRQLLDQLVGSEGTLGIITTITLRLIPCKTFAHTTCIPITEPSLLMSTLEIAKHHQAEHIYFYDETFAGLTERYHTGLLPNMGQAKHMLLVTHYDSDKERLHGTVRRFTRALSQPQESLLFIEDATLIERITPYKHLYNMLETYTGGSHTALSIGDGIIVPTAHYADMFTALDTYLASTGKLYVLTGNAGSGHLSVVTLFDSHSPSYEAELDIYMQALCSMVQKNKGGLSALGGDGLMRTPFLSHIYNEATIDVFKKIKVAWDARGILNPLKKIGATNDYLHRHLTRS